MSKQEEAPPLAAAPDTAEDPDRTLAPSRLLLVRHGESTWNVQRRMQGQLDPPLSERGMAQARKIADRFAGPLAGPRPVAFYTSDLTRACQTAGPIAAVIGMEPLPEPGLREIGLGAWEGKTREEAIAEFPDIWAQWAREPDWDIVPGGEGAEPFRLRVVETLRGLRERHPEGDVLCVTHAGVVQLALLDVVGVDSRGMFPFLIENCSLTVIQRAGGRAFATSVNDTCHLI